MHFAARLKKVNGCHSDRCRKVYGPLYYNINGNRKSPVVRGRDSAHDKCLSLV